MLFRQRFLDGIRDGTITLAFRRWRRPSLRSGGTRLTAVGQLRQTLDLIRSRPAVRAGDLCRLVGLELRPFKTNVRKRKALGLTESLEVGYRLSLRGAVFVRLCDGED